MSERELMQIKAQFEISWVPTSLTSTLASNSQFFIDLGLGPSFLNATHEDTLLIDT